MKFRYIAAAFFLFILVEVAILRLKEGLSLVRLLEIFSVTLLIIVFYSILRKEIEIVSKTLEKRLLGIEGLFERVERRFENVERRFEKVEPAFERAERRLERTLKVLKKEIAGLSDVVRALHKDVKLLKGKR